MEGDKTKKKRRKTTALDRAVIKYREGRKTSYNRIFQAIQPVIRNVANQFVRSFPGNDVNDLMQEAYLHIQTKVIPAYNPDLAGFRTLVKISVTNKFRTMLRQILNKEKYPDNLPIITFTEFELNNEGQLLKIADGKEMLDDILIDDFLRLFKERLTKDSWAIYIRLYRDRNFNFKRMAKDMNISMMGLYRRCKSIYTFLKMLIEKEGENE